MGLESKMAVPSASVLHAAHGQIASACASQNQAFLACKNKDANPAACLPQGEQVTGCVLSLMRRLNESCPDQLEAYSACLDKNNMSSASAASSRPHSRNVQHRLGSNSRSGRGGVVGEAG